MSGGIIKRKGPRNSILPVFVPHLGCPHNCVFCNQNCITGKQHPATPDMVRTILNEARRLPSYPTGRQLAFYGGSFTAIPVEQQESLLKAANEGLKEGIIQSIRISTRPDAINPDILQFLHQYEVSTIEIGCQSMDLTVLRLSGRGHSPEDTISACQQIQSAGFQLILQMMTGLPGDDGCASLYTAQELIRLHPDGVRIYPTVIVKGTTLYEMWKKGAYREHTIEDAVSCCSKILPLFHEARIPVIRLGLNPTEDLSSGDAVAGAYHPALGEMVQSRIWRERMESRLVNVRTENRPLRILVPAFAVSQVIGQHRCNILFLLNRFHLRSVKVCPLPSRVMRIKMEGRSASD